MNERLYDYDTTPECPCYGCKDRCLLCHAHCKEYAKYSKAMSERAKRSVSEIEANSVMFEQKRRIASAISTGFYGFWVAVGFILGAALFGGVSWLVIYFVWKVWGDKDV